jgi:pimeloyl-ACP methyl ester carboxylesterase
MTVVHAADAIPAEPVEFAGTGGVTVRGDRWTPHGSPHGPDVLMLHGGGQSRHSWKTTGAQLAARGFRVTSVDSRGHGDSDWAPDGDYELPALAADVLSVLDQLGRPVVLVGASMGGLTGLVVTPQAGPAVVQALVLVDVVPRYEKAGSERIRTFMMSGMDGFANLDDAADAVAAYLPHRAAPRSSEGLRRNLRERGGRWYWHWDPAFMTRPAASPAERLDELEVAARAIRVPVLLLRGGLSDVVSAAGVDEFRRLVPHVDTVDLPRAAHTAAGDDNEAFATAVLDFVARIGTT